MYSNNANLRPKFLYLNFINNSILGLNTTKLQNIRCLKSKPQKKIAYLIVNIFSGLPEQQFATKIFNVRECLYKRIFSAPIPRSEIQTPDILL